MSVWLGNPLVLIANFIVPLLIAYVCALKWGPNKGALYGVVPAVVAVFILFVLQVSPGLRPDGSGRLASAYGYNDERGLLLARQLCGRPCTWYGPPQAAGRARVSETAVRRR